MNLKVWFVFLLSCNLSNVWAQKPLSPSFHHLKVEDGLSNAKVMAMHKDSRGFMWLGTLNGLTRFDGINCKVYKPTNSGLRDVA